MQPGIFAENCGLQHKFSNTLLPIGRYGSAGPSEVTILKFISKQIPLPFTK
jgi:hypothetical protein